MLKRVMCHRICMTVLFRMAAVVIFLVVAGVPKFGPSASAQEMPPELWTYPQTALSGQILAEISATEGRCRQICVGSASCAGFDHASVTNKCSLYTGFLQPLISLSNTAGTRNLLQNYTDPSNKPEPEEITFNRILNFDMAGNDINVLPSISVMQCESDCKNTVGCKAYTYNSWNKKCFLKYSTSSLRLEPRATTGIVTDLPTPGFQQTMVRIEYYKNYYMVGQPIRTLGSADRDGCQRACMNDSQCVAFTFYARRNGCELFSFAEDRLSRSGTFSGAKIQPRP